MKGNNGKFMFNEHKLDEIDHQLRLIRIFCNHSKHGDTKENLSNITMSTIFPCKFPIKFDYLKVGESQIEITPVIKAVIDFWDKEIHV